MVLSLAGSCFIEHKVFQWNHLCRFYYKMDDIILRNPVADIWREKKNLLTVCLFEFGSHKEFYLH